MKQFQELSDWIVLEYGCATRIIKDGDINNIAHRIAFIEKTPRVRIDKNMLCVEMEHGKPGCCASKHDAWLYGSKGYDGYDEDSREWCDKMLELLGWE